MIGLIGWLLLCFIVLPQILAANTAVFDDKFDISGLISICRFCWENRLNLDFLEEEHHFDLDAFPYADGADRLQQAMAKWRGQVQMPLNNHEISWPKREDSAENRHNHIVYEIYFQREVFNSLLAERCSAIYFFYDSTTGFSAAFLTILSSNHESLQVLLNKYPNLAKEPIKSTNTTPLHLAVLTAEYRCMSILLQRGADPFLQDFNCNSPLDLLLGKGDWRALKIFIEKGNILKNQAFKPAAAYFIHAGRLSEATWLISKGASAAITDPSKKANLLHLAIKLKDAPSFHYLCKVIWDRNVVVDVVSADCVDVLQGLKAAVLKRDYDGKSLATVAIEAQSSACFNFLIKSVHRFLQLDLNKKELLDLVLLAVENNFVAALEFAFTIGLSPNDTLQGMTLLAHAIELEQYECAAWMIRAHGGRLAEVQLSSHPLYLHALFTRNLKLLEFLFSFNLAKNFLLSDGRRVLNYLIEEGDFELVLWFLDHGANPYLPDLRGISALTLVFNHYDLDFKHDFFARTWKFNQFIA